MPRAARDRPGPVHGVQQPTPGRASVFSRTVRAGPRLPRSMALITAALGSGLQHPRPLGAGAGGGARAGRGGERGRRSRPPCQDVGWCQVQGGLAKAGRGRGGAGLRPGHAGQAGAVVPSVLPPARLRHKMAEGCGGHFVEPSADKGRWWTKADGSQSGDVSQSGSKELALWKPDSCPVLSSGRGWPEREGASRAFSGTFLRPKLPAALGAKGPRHPLQGAPGGTGTFSAQGSGTDDFPPHVGGGPTLGIDCCGGRGSLGSFWMKVPLCPRPTEGRPHWPEVGAASSQVA